MPYIIIYEPKEGLKYYLQKYKGDWQWNGLCDNAYEFKNAIEAENAKKHLLLNLGEVAHIKEIKEGHPKG